jgi:5'-3' exonuclease
MYPERVKIDTHHKDMNWSCIPLLPYLDIDRIIDATRMIKVKDQTAEDYYL